MRKVISILLILLLAGLLAAAVTGEKYTANLKCNDAEAEFAIYYNPGKENDFDKTGLSLSKSGTISGTPTEPGTYTFSVIATLSDGSQHIVVENVAFQKK